MSDDFRKRVLGPALIPLGAFAFIGVLVFGFSQILLAVPKDGSVVLGVLMAGCILFAGFAVSKGGALKASQRFALMAFALMVLSGGVAVAFGIGTRPVEPHLQVAAKIATASQGTNYAFDTKELKLPADEPFIFEFDNKDPVPHNVAIYKDQAAANTQAPAGIFFKGAIFAGPKVAEYEVEKGIPTGVYFFRCDVHPFMTGAARVGAATGPAPSPAPTGSATPAPTASPSPQPSPTGPVTAIGLVAKNIAFDKKELEFPAGASIAIDFDNQDAGLPHNFALYRDAAFTQPLFKGQFVTGPAKFRYEFPAPAAGTYYFQCDAHPVPAMRGTVLVR